ncbi:hypothetical protein [Microlunatus sp. Gsoil 973]|uniref:hypothetical protein n=1 Tax=Microlunatus sp. Gsoil 973 TaxID=2672569 RepID=UPI001E61FEC1|nr:hypothetical protein [Microlunatus sp. Gsoil 973]
MIPLGERALRSILDHVIDVGDEAETTYLEVKSSADPTSKSGSVKIAKFLLGAANRRPQEAAHHFRGYAVLVIGAGKGSVQGVPRGVEAHELEDRLQQYLGPQFPGFEFGRVSVDDDREVLFVIALPPEDAQTIFPCHKGFQGEDRRDSLENGAIYVRGTSNTRPARAGEVLMLVERARGGGKSPIDLDVQILGSIGRVDRIDEVMEVLRRFEEERFTKPEVPTERPAAYAFLASDLFRRTKPMSADERAERLEAWRRKRASHISKGREHLLGVGLPGVGIRVVSRDRFVAKPHLIVTFHGCEVIDHRDVDDADYSKLVEPVVSQQGPYRIGLDPSLYRVVPREYPVDWENYGDDAKITLTPESFRPNVPWESNVDDYVLVARDSEAATVSVSWVLTEDGNDTVTTGDFEIPVSELIDAADLIRSTFLKNQ